MAGKPSWPSCSEHRKESVMPQKPETADDQPAPSQPPAEGRDLPDKSGPWFHGPVPWAIVGTDGIRGGYHWLNDTLEFVPLEKLIRGGWFEAVAAGQEVERLTRERDAAKVHWKRCDDEVTARGQIIAELEQRNAGLRERLKRVEEKIGEILGPQIQSAEKYDEPDVSIGIAAARKLLKLIEGE